MRVRFTVRRQMILVGLLAMASALIRVHPALAALAAGVSSLALIRTFERIDRSLAAGLPMRSSGVVWTFVASMAVATTIFMVSLLPASCLLPAFFPVGARPRLDSDTMARIGVLALLAIPIAAFLRRKIW
jgi:hypothetical protein